MNISNPIKAERNKWYKTLSPESPRPPFEEYILVVTIEGMCFFAFRKGNIFFCTSPTPAGVLIVELEECFIDQWMMPAFPVDLEEKEKPEISLVSENEHSKIKANQSN